MALPAVPLPFGLRDVKLIPLGADGSTPGTSVDLFAAQTFTFQETVDTQQLRGDDKYIATHDTVPALEWTLEAGGISLEAYAVLAGGTVTQTGTTPAIKKVYSKTVAQNRPYFKVEGQAMNDNGGDTHGLVYKCKADGNLEGGFADGEFWITKASGTSYGSTESGSTDKLYDFIQNETAVSIT